MLQQGQIIPDPMACVMELAAQGAYSVSPNPKVAAILLREGQVVGYGVHHYRGDMHAETKAIAMAGARAHGATLYVNLEPCCHFGMQPPCVDAIIKAGIAAVHVANIDPNPTVHQKGIQALGKAGIPVFIGEQATEGEHLNRQFFHFHRHNSPWVIGKWAMSLDGKIAANQDSQWITQSEARQKAHQIRNSVDAIIVGHNTILQDNPMLNVRTKHVLYTRTPYKIVLTNHLDLIPKNANIFVHNSHKTIVVTREEPSVNNQKFLESIGVQLIVAHKNAMIDLKLLLKKLAEQSITQVLIEGGGKTLAHFLADNLIHEFYCFLGAKIVTGSLAPSPFSVDIGIDKVAHARNVTIKKVQKLGEDLMIQGDFNV